MKSSIEDYAMIGDGTTGALVSRESSIDWLCLPRFDSRACFAALLGTAENGRWLIQPQGTIRNRRRTYRGDTLVLETEFETETGTVALIDLMSLDAATPDLVRIVEGRRGTVPMRMELVLRLDYGKVVPWVRRNEEGLVSIAGPDAFHLRTDIKTRGEDYKTVAEFEIHEGERKTFDLTWYPSHESVPESVDPLKSLEDTEKSWKTWAEKCTYEGPWRDAVIRSLITLKALIYRPTGGIIAALTTSLPEHVGGERNWDYRYCWLRDAAFTLTALLDTGYKDEAMAWRDWLMRAVAELPSQIQPLYGVAGERWLPELELPWLQGYADSKPVRVGNGAYSQFQLDVFGEVLDVTHLARERGLPAQEHTWQLQAALVEHLESIWQEPDNGIWEVRSERRHFTHSKVMAWLAADCAVQAVERFQLKGPVKKWRELRDSIHADVCRQGFNEELNTFTQSYGSRTVDASLLMLPLVKFLPATDPRIRGTIDAVQQRLKSDGLIRRYEVDESFDGFSDDEGAFLMCTFWLADALALSGRKEEALELFERLLELRNDVGLLPEQYDPVEKHFLGNFPQAFSHVALINSARILSKGTE